MARVRHTITGIVSDVPDHLVNHPTLGEYLVDADAPVDPDCKPCLEEAKAKAAAQEADEAEPTIKGTIDLSAIDTDNEDD